MGTVDAGTIEGIRAASLPHHRPRPGDRLRQGRRQDGRDLAQARELRPGHPLAAPVPRHDDRQVKPGELLQGRVAPPFTFNIGYADDRDIAMYSAGKLPLRDRASTRACPPRAPASTSGRASWRRARTRSRSIRRPAARELEQPPGARLGRRRRQLDLRLLAPGAAADGRAGEAPEARPRLGHLGDERRRDAGPAQRRARRRRWPALLNGRPGAERRAAAHARAARGVARDRPSRLDRDLDGVMDAGPARRSWTPYPQLADAVMQPAARPAAGRARRARRARPAPGSDFTGGGSGTSTRTCGR